MKSKAAMESSEEAKERAAVDTDASCCVCLAAALPLLMERPGQLGPTSRDMHESVSQPAARYRFMWIVSPMHRRRWKSASLITTSCWRRAGPSEEDGNESAGASEESSSSPLSSASASAAAGGPFAPPPFSAA